MRFNLRRNLYLKLFSLLLAIACWFVRFEASVGKTSTSVMLAG